MRTGKLSCCSLAVGVACGFCGDGPLEMDGVVSGAAGSSTAVVGVGAVS